MLGNCARTGALEDRLIRKKVVTTLHPNQAFFCVQFRAKRERLKKFLGLLPERQGRDLGLTALHVKYSLGSGR